MSTPTDTESPLAVTLPSSARDASPSCGRLYIPPDALEVFLETSRAARSGFCILSASRTPRYPGYFPSPKSRASYMGYVELMGRR